MCGLLAGSGKLETDYIVSLGVSNMERGVDSAGIGYLNKDGSLQTDKIAQHPAVAFPVSLRPSICRGIRQGVMIGHTRQATTGDITNENAHPFLVDDIAFAHNGIILNYKEFGTYKVDSESLIHGIKLRDFSKYEGNIALVWIERGLLHAYASGNPLYRGVLDGGMYLASEKEMLERLGARHIKPLSEDHIYIFKEDKIQETIFVKGPEFAFTSKANFDQTWTNYGKDWPDTDDETIKDETPKYERLCLSCSVTKLSAGQDYCYHCLDKYGLIKSKVV
jgi:glucosamine 6-phosphate synthetase-like amidotransferase/phosphosugar isomerase protein